MTRSTAYAGMLITLLATVVAPVANAQYRTCTHLVTRYRSVPVMRTRSVPVQRTRTVYRNVCRTVTRTEYHTRSTSRGYESVPEVVSHQECPSVSEQQTYTEYVQQTYTEYVQQPYTEYETSSNCP